MQRKQVMGTGRGWCEVETVNLDTILGYVDQEMEMNDNEDHNDTTEQLICEPHKDDGSYGTNVHVPCDEVEEMILSKSSKKCAVGKLPHKIGGVRPLGQNTSTIW